MKQNQRQTIQKEKEDNFIFPALTHSLSCHCSVPKGICHARKSSLEGKESMGWAISLLSFWKGDCIMVPLQFHPTQTTTSETYRDRRGKIKEIKARGTNSSHTVEMIAIHRDLLGEQTQLLSPLKEIMTSRDTVDLLQISPSFRLMCGAWGPPPQQPHLSPCTLHQQPAQASMAGWEQNARVDTWIWPLLLCDCSEKALPAVRLHAAGLTPVTILHHASTPGEDCIATYLTFRALQAFVGINQALSTIIVCASLCSPDVSPFS